MKEEEKIACHVCKKVIPKSAALQAEGKDYVYYFCNTDCLNYWKKNQKKKENKKN
jgi:YHS domain-containing protein